MLGIILLLLACAFFTAGEMASVSSDWVKLRYWTDKRVKGAKFALNLLRNPDRLIMTMLVGTNLTMVALSVVASKAWYHKLPAVASSLIITILIFVFAEILPKTLVLKGKERFFLVFAKVYVVLYWIFYPIIFLTYQISMAILRALNVPRITRLPKFTKEEISIASRRALSITEQSFVTRLFEFKNKLAKHIMIPKSLIYAAPLNSEIQELKNIISQSGFSRIPIYNTTIDDIVGYVFARDLLTAKTLKDIIRPCKSISETTPVGILFDELREKESFFVIVKDAGNRTTGILTMEDVIEELFGEIEDEYDRLITNNQKDNHLIYKEKNQT